METPHILHIPLFAGTCDHCCGVFPALRCDWCTGGTAQSDVCCDYCNGGCSFQTERDTSSPGSTDITVLARCAHVSQGILHASAALNL
jgi:hypothetical protein